MLMIGEWRSFAKMEFRQMRLGWKLFGLRERPRNEPGQPQCYGAGDKYQVGTASKQTLLHTVCTKYVQEAHHYTQAQI
jgi:hypothetical protein